MPLFGDSGRSSVYLPHAKVGIREKQGVAGSLAFSYIRLNIYDDFFPDDFGGAFACRQIFVCFDHQSKRVLEVAPYFGESFALGIHTRNFFDEGDIPFPALLDYRGELTFHMGNSSRNMRSRPKPRNIEVRRVLVAEIGC